MNPISRSWPRLLCAGALALTSLMSLSAHAQYSWIDDKGARVFSDRPPPPGTPAARILKSPRGLEAPAPAAPVDAEASPASAAAPAVAKTAVPGWKEREADYRKRAAQRDKVEQEAETKRRAEQASRCNWARGARQQLTTARRLMGDNAKGERQLMSDEDRAREMEKVQRTLADCG